ncbi:MAG: hypothetical protein H6599_00740 [Flavobacteriales bacterium]|nr:hypothetical protein [Flavobacteriales bacterium]
MTSEILTEIVVSNLLTAKLLDKGIVEIIWHEDVLEVEPEHLIEMQNTVKEIGGGRKMPLLFDPKHVIATSKSGRAYATSEEGVQYSKAIAVVNENLAQVLMMNFFMRVSTPVVPTKGFKTRESAIKWLTENFV